jgi:hypothetical protein
LDPPFSTDFQAKRKIAPGKSIVTTDGVTVSSYLDQTTLGVGGGLYVLRPRAPNSREALHQAISGTGFRFGFLVTSDQCAQGVPDTYRSGQLVVRARTDGTTVTLTVEYDAYWAEAAFITIATVSGAVALVGFAMALWIVRNPARAGSLWMQRQSRQTIRAADATGSGEGTQLRVPNHHQLDHS